VALLKRGCQPQQIARDLPDKKNNKMGEGKSTKSLAIKQVIGG